MAFQIKSFLGISAAMINYVRGATRKITDFSVGSVTRTWLEASAAEIDELYQQMANGLNEAIPVSVFNSFSFDRIPAVAATGMVRVTAVSSSSARLISAGATFTRSDGTVYASTSDVTLAVGNTYVDVPVAARVAGAAGNISGTGTTSFEMSPEPEDFISAVAISGFASGGEQETDAQRKARFNSFISTLARGTPAAIEYGLKSAALYDQWGNVVERVVDAVVVEPYLTDVLQPIALVNCYIHNGSGGTSDALLARAKDVVYGYTKADGTKVAGYKAAGIPCPIAKAVEQAVPVTAVLTLSTSAVQAGVVAAVSAAWASYIAGRRTGGAGAGEAAVLVAKLEALALEVAGVTDVAVSAPAANVVPAVGVKLMPGAMSITCV